MCGANPLTHKRAFRPPSVGEEGGNAHLNEGSGLVLAIHEGHHRDDLVR